MKLYPETPIARRLSPAEMEKIQIEIEAATSPAMALTTAIITTFDCLLSEDEVTCADILLEDNARIDGRRLVIPSDQWIAIADLLKAVPNDSVDGANIVLDWMNRGPSGQQVIKGGPDFRP